MEQKKETRVCKSCGKELPLESFPKNRNGYISVCRECRYKKKEGSFVTNRYGLSQKPLAISISMYSDQDLLNELKERGWKGSLSKEIKYEL